MRDLQTAVHCSLREGNSLEGFHVKGLEASGIYAPACLVESWGATIRDPTWEDVDVGYVYGGRPKPVVKDWKTTGNGVRALPAWAFHAKNVSGLKMRNTAWKSDSALAAEALGFDGVSDVGIAATKVNGQPWTRE